MDKKDISTVYARLATARKLLQEKNLKKSGKNAFSRAEYFELGDFLPSITKINEALGLISLVNFSSDEATMRIVCTDDLDGEDIIFATPMATGDLRGLHPMQAIGAMETYARRYLYLMAYDIAEADTLDARDYVGADKTAPQRAARRATPPKQDAQKEVAKAPEYLTKAEIARLMQIAVEVHGDRAKEALQYINDHFGVQKSSQWPRKAKEIEDRIRLWDSPLEEGVPEAE